MNRTWLKRFAHRWFEEWRPNPPVYGPATQLLVRRLEQRPVRAWQLILALVEFAPDSDALSMVGAGPLEDLLGMHGPSFIAAAEERAALDPRFLSSLRQVWLRPDDPVFSRLDAATGGQHCG